MKVGAALGRSNLIVIAVPVNKSCHTFFNTGVWFVVDVSDKVADISISVWYVASLEWQ